MDKFVIAIARKFGSKGKQIGLALSEALGVPCYDNEILTMASEQSGINESAFYEANERLRYANLKRFLSASPRDYVVSPSSKQFTSDDNLYNIQAQIIKELAANESCIIMGKSANTILADRDGLVSVFVTAPEKYCINEISLRMKVDTAIATEMVRKTNHYRRQYCEYYSRGLKWDLPDNYDLCINTAKVDKDLAVKMIQDYTLAKIGMNS